MYNEYVSDMIPDKIESDSTRRYVINKAALSAAGAAAVKAACKYNAVDLLHHLIGSAAPVGMEHYRKFSVTCGNISFPWIVNFKKF